MAEVKTSEARDITRKALGLAVAKHRNKLVALLKKHGVSADTSTDDKLIVATLAAMRDSGRFRDDLREVLTKTTTETVGFTAEYNSFFFTGTKFFNWEASYNDLSNQLAGSSTAPASTSTSTKSTAGQLLSDPKLIGSILNTGLTTLSNSLTAKSNQKLADTTLQIEAEKTKQAALLAQGGGAAANNPGGLSTGAIIGITLGSLALVGVVIWLVVRKK